MKKQLGASLDWLIIALVVLGAIIILAGVVGLIIQLSSRADIAAIGSIAMTATSIVAGIFLLATAAMSKLIMRQSEQSKVQRQLLERLCAMQTPTPPAPSKAATTVDVMAATPFPALEEKPMDVSRTQMLELLQQIRDSAMMNETQREQYAIAHWAKRKEAISKLVERHMLSGDWAMAKSRLEELRALMPADPEVQKLRDRVEMEHATRLTEDIGAARSQLRHLMSISAWPEAEEIVGALQRKYPREPEVDELAADISNQRETLERQNRERLLSDLADATDRRQWRRAIASAEDFIQRYPTDTYAERLQFDLPTLRDNAAAADRKEQEQLFKDLLKAQRYEEAEGTAKSLIDKYPGSPAAAELMKMLPRVEELHRQDKLKRQHPAPSPATN